MTFYITVSGKQVPWNPSKEDPKWIEYKEISLSIWGALPFDITWAINTQIYQNELIKHGKV